MSEDIQKQVQKYLLVFYALLAGTVLTVAVSYVDLGQSGNIFVAFIIASIKASLVVLFFMHLIHEKRTVYMIMAVTVFFCLGLFLLTLFSMADVPRIR